MRKHSIGPLLVGAFVALSLAAVVGGFLVIGTPAQQRLLALDKKRTDDLLQIARAINIHWDRSGQLPASLSDTTNEWVQQLRDPESGQPYSYEVTGNGTYKLCAVFALADDDPAEAPWEWSFATHAQGSHCFSLTAGGGGMLSRPPSLIR